MYFTIRSFSSERPIVQYRTSPEDILGIRLQKAAAIGDLETIQSLLEMVMQFHEKLAQIGINVVDNMTSNYVVEDDGVLIQDIGAFVLNQDDLDASRYAYDFTLKTNLLSFHRAVAPILVQKEGQKIFEGFEARFKKSYLQAEPQVREEPSFPVGRNREEKRLLNRKIKPRRGRQPIPVQFQLG